MLFFLIPRLIGLIPWTWNRGVFGCGSVLPAWPALSGRRKTSPLQPAQQRLELAEGPGLRLQHTGLPHPHSSGRHFPFFLHSKRLLLDAKQ